MRVLRGGRSMTAVVAGIIAFTIGTLFGLWIAGRHIDLECETAYLTGHVDGYGKAMFDAGEVGR